MEELASTHPVTRYNNFFMQQFWYIMHASQVNMYYEFDIAFAWLAMKSEYQMRQRRRKELDCKYKQC